LPHGPFAQRHTELAEYIIQFCSEMTLSVGTACRAFVLMARATAKLPPVPTYYVQLVALVCIFIAAKYEETAWQQALSVDELVAAGDERYSREEFIVTERDVLAALQWKVGDVTPACFASHFLEYSASGDPELDTQVKRMFIEVLVSGLKDPSISRHLPSNICASALLLARTLAKQQIGGTAVVDSWGDDMVALTGYTAAALRPCAGRIWQQYLPSVRPLLQAAGNVSRAEAMERFVLTHVLEESVTPVCFASFYLTHSSLGSPQLDKRVEEGVVYLLRLIFPVSLPVPPSIKSAAALMVARAHTEPSHRRHDDCWGEDMVALTGYSTTDLHFYANHLRGPYKQYLQRTGRSA
jgi:hypothetical protein